jgi:hypothetical protein
MGASHVGYGGDIMIIVILVARIGSYSSSISISMSSPISSSVHLNKKLSSSSPVSQKIWIWTGSWWDFSSIVSFLGRKTCAPIGHVRAVQYWCLSRREVY